MGFSNPVLIGEMWWKGRQIRTVNSLEHSMSDAYYDFQGAREIVRFYVRPPGPVGRLGSPTDIKNTADFLMTTYTGIFESIYDGSEQFYIIKKDCFCFSGPTITIIGIDRSGQYKKYADYVDFKNAYENEPPVIGVMGKKIDITVKNNTLIFLCHGEKNRWSYHLKWNNLKKMFEWKFETT